MQSTEHSLDAARHYDPLFEAADRQARIEAGDVAAARDAVAAIHAIPDFLFSEDVVAQLCSVLSAKVAKSNWSHTAAAEMASASLDDTADDLNAAGE